MNHYQLPTLPEFSRGHQTGGLFQFAERFVDVRVTYCHRVFHHSLFPLRRRNSHRRSRLVAVKVGQTPTVSLQQRPFDLCRVANEIDFRVGISQESVGLVDVDLLNLDPCAVTQSSKRAGIGNQQPVA